MPRTYVDNAPNRRLGRVGMPVGSMVVSRSSSRGGSYGSSSSSYSSRTYVGDSYNWSLLMAYGTTWKSGSSSLFGSPNQKSTISLGSMPDSRSSSKSYSSSPEVYVHSPSSHSLGWGSTPRVSEESQSTDKLRAYYQWLRDHPDEDLEMMETDNDEYTAEIVMNLISRQ